MHTGIPRKILITGLAATSFGLGTMVGAKQLWQFLPALPARAAITAAAEPAAVHDDTPEAAAPAVAGRGLPSFASLVDKVAPAVVHVDVVSVVKADNPGEGFRSP